MSTDWRSDPALRHSAWLVPLLLAVHNLEEGLALPSWLGKHAEELQALLRSLGVAALVPPPAELQPLLTRYSTALVIVTVVPLLICLFARATSHRAGLHAILALQAVVFANVFSHVGAALIFRGYSPGVLTAVAFNLPFSLHLFRAARRSDHIGSRGLAALIVGAALALGPLTLGALGLGGRIAGP